ncbi:MAG: hydroxyethylthiazole kinase [Eggerthellaceae bacterium]|nr:hydroxyethylthiazole kinase [Eggerthellaceae bacterium]
MDTENLRKFLSKVYEASPLVHSITNYVTVNDCANALLACGAAPVMSDDETDAPQITAISSALNLNIGTLNQHSIPGMFASAKVANERKIPILLDPVGVGATQMRNETAIALLDQAKPQVVRCNASEIKSIASILWKDSPSGKTRGVDASIQDKITEDNLKEACTFLKNLAKKWKCVIAVSGEIDVITDYEKTFIISNGHEMMSKITGSGCMLSAIIPAFLAIAEGENLEACASAVCMHGLAGEIAAGRMTELNGNSTYRNYLIDAIYNMTEAQLEEGAKYECR